MKRSRLIYLLLWCAVIVVALATRRLPGQLPRFIGLYGGDILWATMIFLGAGVVFARWPTLRLMVFALLFCYAAEVSQLYHAPWIDAIRDTRLGGLILGCGFLWSDIVCYTVGAGLGGLLDVFIVMTARERIPQ